MGDPNATEIPAAAAADSTSRFRAIPMLEKCRMLEKHSALYLHCRRYYQTIS